MQVPVLFNAAAQLPGLPEGTEVGDLLMLEAVDGGAWRVIAVPDGFGLPAGGTDGQVLAKTVGGFAWVDMPADVDEVPDNGTPGWFLTKTAGGVAWAALDLGAIDARVTALENATAPEGYDDTALAARVTTLEVDVAMPFIGVPEVPAVPPTLTAGNSFNPADAFEFVIIATLSDGSGTDCTVSIPADGVGSRTRQNVIDDINTNFIDQSGLSGHAVVNLADDKIEVVASAGVARIEVADFGGASSGFAGATDAEETPRVPSTGIIPRITALENDAVMRAEFDALNAALGSTISAVQNTQNRLNDVDTIAGEPARMIGGVPYLDYSGGGGHVDFTIVYGGTDYPLQIYDAYLPAGTNISGVDAAALAGAINNAIGEINSSSYVLQISAYEQDGHIYLMDQSGIVGSDASSFEIKDISLTNIYSNVSDTGLVEGVFKGRYSDTLAQRLSAIEAKLEKLLVGAGV